MLGKVKYILKNTNNANTTVWIRYPTIEGDPFCKVSRPHELVKLYINLDEITRKIKEVHNVIIAFCAKSGF
jgi:hypothetical protein